MTISTIIPFKQIRPGDALEPVQEWAKQFEGNLRMEGDLLDYFVENTNDALIPHGLGRPIFGAVLLGIFNDLSIPGPDPISYAVNIESSTATHFRVELSANVTGTSRWLVF